MSGLVCLATIELVIRMSALSPLAHDPIPADGAAFIDPDAELSWSADANATGFDIYLGTDQAAVAAGTGDTLRGRQEKATFDGGPLDPLATYYWRVDEICADGQIRPGTVWSFTTVDFVVIDDFESYTDERGHQIFQTWVDGWGVSPDIRVCPGNGTGATVGHIEPPFAERDIVHRGRQSMPVDYNNVWPPHYSEAERCYLHDPPQDWTIRGMDTLSLWFRGQADNGREGFYVALEDSGGRTGVVRHPDPNAVLITEWHQWQVRLTAFAFGPVDVAAIKHFYIGIGDHQKPQRGGAGIVYIDDIRLMRCAPFPEPNGCDLVIDDFESYTDDIDNRIFQAWFNGWESPYQTPEYPDDCTGALVGHAEPPFAEQSVVHGGRQSMPMDYNNAEPPYYSEAFYQWETPQDWLHISMNTLSLWFRGEQNNSTEPLYIALRDNARHVKVVNHPDPTALRATEWQQWLISLATFTPDEMNMSALKRMYIGVGDRQKPEPGGAGTIFIDDIMLTK